MKEEKKKKLTFAKAKVHTHTQGVEELSGDSFAQLQLDTRLPTKI